MPLSANLPPQQREVLVLIAILGVSYEETASICGCAIGTIKSRLNRARMSSATAVDSCANVPLPLGQTPSRRWRAMPMDAGNRR